MTGLHWLELVMLFRKRSATGGALHNRNGARRPRDLSSGPHTARRSLVSPRQPLPHTAGRIRLCPCGFALISGRDPSMTDKPRQIPFPQVRRTCGVTRALTAVSCPRSSLTLLS
jgi:hypothetical protein